MSVYRKYFVSYAFYSKDMEGFGSATVNRHGPVTDMQAVSDMTAAIKKQSPPLKDTQITIINWRRYENEE